MAASTMSQQQQHQQPSQQIVLTEMDKLRNALLIKNIQLRLENTLTVLAAASSKEDFPSMVGGERESGWVKDGWTEVTELR